jgi:hypothetical protein
MIAAARPAHSALFLEGLCEQPTTASALSTSPSALSRPANSAPQDIPAALDRAAIMRRAHAIAQQARPHMLAPR